MTDVDVAVDCADGVGESPVWDDVRQCLYWVDLLAGVIHTVTPSGARTDVGVGKAVGAVGLTDTDELVAAVRDGFAAVSPDTGALRMLAEVEAGHPERRMNDGKCDPWGGFVAGTMTDDGSAPVGTLYRLGPDGAVTPGETGFAIPNGLDWAGDGETFYHTDTPTGRIDRCRLDPETRLPATREPFVTVEGPGMPDGFTLDTDGCLWVALWGGGRVHRYTPEGRLDRVVEVPVRQPASCAFGGPDLRTLFITTARHGLGDPRPPEGAVFAVTGLAQGRPTPRFPLSGL